MARILKENHDAGLRETKRHKFFFAILVLLFDRINSWQNKILKRSIFSKTECLSPYTCMALK